MTRSPWRAAFAAAFLLVSASVLAGCVGTAAASAAELRTDADDAARAWSADAQLAQAVGIEGTFPMAMMLAAMGAGGVDSGSESAAKEDEKVGDGLCQAWVYRYVSATKPDEAFVVIVGSDGDILQQSAEARGEDDEPLGQWTLDSDAAVEKALAVNEGLRTGLGSERYGFASILGQHEGAPGPAWLIVGGGGSSAGGGGGFVLIDAVNGVVLANEGGAKTF